MPSLFYIVYIIWFFSEILINRLFRSKKTDKKNEDKGSLYLLWTIIIIGNFSAVYVSNKYIMPISNNYIIGYAGLALISLGILLRFYIIGTLGKFFTVVVTIKQNHKLKKDGFYKYVRHPSYFASILSFTGFGISLNNWISLIIIIVLVSSAFIIRINIEEKLLIGHFGSEYLEYKGKTKRLIPFIY